MDLEEAPFPLRERGDLVEERPGEAELADIIPNRAVGAGTRIHCLHSRLDLRELKPW